MPQLLPTIAEALPGLSVAEAAKRLAEDGPNALPGSAPKSTFVIVLGVLTEPMFVMLLLAGGIYLALGDRAEAMFLLAFVFVVIGITLVQERKTQRALESLRDLSAPRALVMRGGETLRIAGHDVVRGDLLVLREGDRVAADALLRSGQLSVDESLLTGEAVPVTKLPSTEAASRAGDRVATPGGEEGSAALFASTVVTRGTGVAEVCAVAAATAVGRIGEALNATQEQPSTLQRNSRRLVRNLGIGASALAATQVLLSWRWDGRPLLDSLLSGIALAMAVLPEEIPVILTVFLAMGAWRISKEKVLTRSVAAVEALGAITVLAVDKTGTLTQNRMTVAELSTADGVFTPTGAGSMPDSFHSITEFASLATPGDPFDPMEKAIREFAKRWLEGTEHLHEASAPEHEYEIMPEFLAMTKVFASAHPAEHLLATKGAPEAVADLCHLEGAQREVLRQQVKAMAELGLRVLGVARGTWTGVVNGLGVAPDWPKSQDDFNFAFLGLLGLADPPRPEVPAALAQCRAAGVRVMMMTGDHPATALAIARQVGLSESPEVITGEQINALDDKALLDRLRKVDLCARLQPAHKLRLVQVLRAAGEVVAMTGDGVNDAPALKAADVGIAMGEHGTDVAREAAALVLLDDSFERIVAAIRQGRRIYDNIRKATRFTFAVHMPIIALAVAPVLLHWPVLLLPIHIVLLELLIDPACSIVFEAEPESPGLMERPPRAPTDSPFSAAHLANGVLQGLGIAAVLLAGDAWLIAQAGDVAQSRWVVFGALVVGVLLLILSNRDLARPALMGVVDRNPWLGRMAVAIALLLTLITYTPLLRKLMGLAVPTLKGMALGLAMILASLVWLELVRRVSQRFASASTPTQ